MATGYTLSEKIRLGIIGIFLVPLRSILLTGQHQYMSYRWLALCRLLKKDGDQMGSGSLGKGCLKKKVQENQRTKLCSDACDGRYTAKKIRFMYSQK
jgi:hypothetical protein